MLAGQAHIMRRRIFQKFFFGQRADLFDGRADIEIAAFQTFAWWHQAACAYHHVVFNDGIVQNNCTHSDQHTIADAAAVRHDFVSDGYVFADDKGRTFRLFRVFVRNVQDTAVLYIAARADADAVHVAAQHGIRPNGYVFGKRYFADDDGGLVDEAGFGEYGLRRGG